MIVFRILDEVKDMGKKKKIPDKYQIWIDARKRYRLSHVQIQMARELGLNPKRFGKLANHQQEPWKAPLPEFVEEIYFKRFTKERPDNVRSIEQLIKDQRKKKEERKKRKEEKRNWSNHKIKSHKQFNNQVARSQNKALTSKCSGRETAVVFQRLDVQRGFVVTRRIVP